MSVLYAVRDSVDKKVKQKVARFQQVAKPKNLATFLATLKLSKKPAKNRFQISFK